MKEKEYGIFSKLDKSAVFTVIGILLLFSTAVIVTLAVPALIDPSWTEPSSEYQVQMFEVADPNTYISIAVRGKTQLEVVNHLRRGYTLQAFAETETVRMVSKPELERYITRYRNGSLRLTSDVLVLREPVGPAIKDAERLQVEVQRYWENTHPDWISKGLQKPKYKVLELIAVEGGDAFSLANSDGVSSDWIDKDFEVIDKPHRKEFHGASGVVYFRNPQEYLVKNFLFAGEDSWQYDPTGKPVASLKDLKSEHLGFLSRQELIDMGEHQIAINGCWYCHTDQTRTLVQDTVLNGSESFPAPPSSANEYIYQKVTFMGTQRIGPDLSRIAIKRPGRDWHKSHFWSPKTKSPGSIMPAFRFFFDNDPRGTGSNELGVPNYKFEAVYQWLMTRGNRITAPTQAWWEGKDPVNTMAIIEGRATKGGVQ